MFSKACRNKTLKPTMPRRSTQGLLTVGDKSCNAEGWKCVSSGTRRELSLHSGSVPGQQGRGWELCEMTCLCQLSPNPTAAPEEVGE